MARQGEVPVLIERGETLARNFRLRAGWVETDDLFVQLLRVCDVVLPLFQLGGLEQFLRLVPAASSEDNTEHNAPYVDPSSHHFPDRSHTVCHRDGRETFVSLG
jgi:hypothetical protein